MVKKGLAHATEGQDAPLEEEPPSTSTILSSLQEHLQKRARTSQAVQGQGPLEPFERLEEVLGPIPLQGLQQVPG